MVEMEKMISTIGKIWIFIFLKIQILTGQKIFKNLKKLKHKLFLLEYHLRKEYIIIIKLTEVINGFIFY